MPEVHSQDRPAENSEDYQRGYRDAQEDMKRDLAAVLRIHAVDSGEPGDAPLTDEKIREIFAGVFGIMATDDEFGPEPSGDFSVEGIVSHLCEAGIPEE